MVQQLFYEACDQLEAEGFDVYGDSELTQPEQTFDLEDS
jgi:hypothetical protein